MECGGGRKAEAWGGVRMGRGGVCRSGKGWSGEEVNVGGGRRNAGEGEGRVPPFALLPSPSPPPLPPASSPSVSSTPFLIPSRCDHRRCGAHRVSGTLPCRGVHIEVVF